MSVFGQQSTTNTEMATGLGQSDYSLKTNYHGSAPLDTTIISDSWLMPSESWPEYTSGGVDCKLVHGDRWQKIEGNMSQHVAQKKASTYDGDFFEYYYGGVRRDMFGPSFAEQYYAPESSRDYIGHVYETYRLGHQQQNEVEEIETRVWKAEVIQNYSTELNPFKFELLGAGATVSGAEVSAVGLGICFRGGEVILAGGKLEFGVYKKEGFVFGDEIKALKSQILPMRNRLALLTYNASVLDLRLGELLATGFVAPG